MQSFGFIGLGIMGSAMAKNLLRAGFQVTVWNRSDSRTVELTSLGAIRGETPRAVIEACPVTFAMLSDPAAAEEVCFGDGGVLAGIGEGKGYVDMSTVDAATSRRIAAAIGTKGGRYLEAPVSGSRKPAEEGNLIILAAGDMSLFDDAMPAFDTMGKKTLFLGEVGNGANMKLVVNMVMGGMMAIFCEGIALAGRAGINPSDLLEVIDSGAIANTMFRLKGGSISYDDFSVAFPLKHMQKDLRLAVSLGDQTGQPLFTAAAANETFKRAREMGLGEEDFSAVFKAVK
jgi:3-hydroxyisobutyrate dehydrogenase-like beta-hydroxyacid dehydrogenase